VITADDFCKGLVNYCQHFFISADDISAFKIMLQRCSIPISSATTYQSVAGVPGLDVLSACRGSWERFVALVTLEILLSCNQVTGLYSNKQQWNNKNNKQPQQQL
jgi:hypothetical protein